MMPKSSFERPTAENARAFTLVEIIVVIVILAIAAAVVVPSLSDAADMKVLAGARRIAGDLEYAQNHAIATGEGVTIRFFDKDDANANSYVVTNTSGTLTHPITKTDYRVVFSDMEGMDGLIVDSVDFDGDPNVTFDALGAPSNAADGKVTIKYGGETYVITVVPVTGRVLVSSP
jgi:general secretion pathway protein H